MFAFAQEKGYYSIGRNAEKLKITGERLSSDSFIRADKGYYSMKINQNKLRRSTDKDTLSRKQFPTVNKGYFSIGNNAAKLEEWSK